MLAVLPILAFILADTHHGPRWGLADVSAAAGYPVFTEAAHPDQVLHLDTASASEVRRCAACLQAGDARLASPTGLSAPVDERSVPASSHSEFVSFSPTDASPRGPPLLTS